MVLCMCQFLLEQHILHFGCLGLDFYNIPPPAPHLYCGQHDLI